MDKFYREELEETQADAEELYRTDARHREVEDTAAGRRTFHPLSDDELAQRRLRHRHRQHQPRDAA